MCDTAAATRCNSRYYECQAASFGNVSHMGFNGGNGPSCQCAKVWGNCAMEAGGQACAHLYNLVYGAFTFCQQPPS